MLFDNQRFLVKERVAVLKLTDTYDIYVPETNQPVGLAREQPPLAAGSTLGTLRSKVLALGGGFLVDDAQGGSYAEVNGDWKGWNFRLVATDGKELGVVTKQWAGLGKEFFTSADNYMISLSDSMGNDPSHSAHSGAGRPKSKWSGHVYECVLI
jgi:hypothetical protein